MKRKQSQTHLPTKTGLGTEIANLFKGVGLKSDIEELRWELVPKNADNDQIGRSEINEKARLKEETF